ncbi:MAG: zinc-binding alcohol dehydrogenase [Pseudomonadota bacterium]
MSVLWHTSASHSEWAPSTHTPTPSQEPITARFSLISTGTERLVSRGRVPESAFDAMRVPNMAGDFNFPLNYGYSLVGLDPHGQAVHCLHPHARQAWLEAGDSIALPASAPLDRMTLTSNLETAMNAAWDAEVGAGDEALICGFGTVGALLALTLRLAHGIEATIVEQNRFRADVARELGFETQDGRNDPASYSLMFNASGSQNGLQWCLDHAAFEARVIELCWYGSTPVTVNLGGAFHFNRVRLVSSQVGHVAPSKRHTLAARDRRAAAIDLLTDAAFDALPREHVPFDDVPAFFDTLRAGTLPNGLFWIIDYGA